MIIQFSKPFFILSFYFNLYIKRLPKTTEFQLIPTLVHAKLRATASKQSNEANEYPVLRNFRQKKTK